MDFYGWNKTTLLDYPGLVAATLFTGGCNFRCPFCHNKNLVLLQTKPIFSQEEVLRFLTKRQGVLQGVCITGGEPTLQPDLPEFIGKVKELGYRVKLDTNGTNPALLENLLAEGLLDYVAMDIKAAPGNYGKVTGLDKPDMSSVEQSVEILKNTQTEYEFRTTVVKGLHEKEEFADIAAWLEGCKAYYLQSYRDDENVISRSFSAFSKEELEELLALVKGYGIPARLRGVEA